MRNLNESARDKYEQELFSTEEKGLFLLARKASDQLGKTAISLSQAEARMMGLIVRAFQPKKFIEIGTLTGYSALWTLESMTSGDFYTIEKDPKHFETAKSILEQGQFSAKVHCLNGDAREVLKNLSQLGPFDGIFIDGNKAAYLDYLIWAEENLRPGGLILADNVLAGGGVFGQGDGRFSEKQIEILRRFNSRLADPKKYRSCLMPTSEGLFAAIKLD